MSVKTFFVQSLYLFLGIFGVALVVETFYYQFNFPEMFENLFAWRSILTKALVSLVISFVMIKYYQKKSNT